ncbi:MAG: OB-fold nucleic acid binding domain-containing protein, partial [Pseudomonadota bacterium]
FDLMEKFAGYGFNKSHSAAYAVLSFQTAWLKAHYPAAFMAAVMTADMDNTDKIVTLIDDCKSLKLTVDLPDVNASQYGFSVSDTRTIRYGLGAIKGVGRGAVESIIEEREANGRFDTVEALCRRIDLGRTNRRVLESLVKAGAMDSLRLNRATLMAQLPDAIRAAEQHARDAAAGQDDLFGVAPPPAPVSPSSSRPAAELPEWPEAERLAAEKETLGLYLTGHPIDEFNDDLPHLTTGRLAAIAGEPPPSDRARFAKRTVTVAGLVLDMRKRGNRVTLLLDDGSARLEASLFEDVFQRYAHIVAKDTVLVIEGNVRFDEFANEWRLTARSLLDIDQARERHVSRMVIRWGVNGEQRNFVRELKDALAPFRQGNCSVSLLYKNGDAAARLHFGQDWSVRPTRELLQRLSELVGRKRIRLIYPRRISASAGD